MRITEVRYERLKSGPGYSNQRVGVTAVVGPDEDAHAALELARAFVARELEEPADRRDETRDELFRLRDAVDAMINKLTEKEIPF